MEDYLTYEEYSLMGGKVPFEEFPPLEFRSRKRLDYVTNHRIKRMKNVPYAVKVCMRELIDLENTCGTIKITQNPTPTSFSNDGYTETYGNALNITTADQTLNRVIYQLLDGEYDDEGTPLLYRGVR